MDAVARMTRGEMTSEAYATALIARCKAQHGLNAFITFEPERVLEDARARDAQRRAGTKPGALFGLPIPVKDSVNTAQYPTSGGTPALRHFRPAADAPVVARLRSAGALVLGKTNLHELSYGWTSNNHAFGAVRNPYQRRRIPGRQQRRHRGGHRRPPRSARRCGGHRRVGTGTRRLLRHRRLSTDHRALFDTGLRTDQRVVRPDRLSCTHGPRSRVVRFGGRQRLGAPRGRTAPGRASRRGARLLVHRPRSGGRTRH